MSAISRAPSTGRYAAVENYFNYFTEIEECFRRCRGTPTFLSTLDWAIIESWKEAGIPLAAVLAGVERSFEKFAARPRRVRKVNSLAYCSQEVLRAAEEALEGGTRPGNSKGATPAFPVEEIMGFFNRDLEALEQASRVAQDKGQPVLAEDLGGAAATLREIAAQETRSPPQPTTNLEELETRLSALEEKLTASLTRASSVELLSQIRQEVERALVPYRQKMSGPQVESLERQFLKKRLFEHYQVPRLSLFYL